MAKTTAPTLPKPTRKPVGPLPRAERPKPPTRAEKLRARDAFAAKVRAGRHATPETIRVEVVEAAGRFHPSEPRTLVRGDVFDLPAKEAAALIAAGTARPWCLVVATRDNVLIPTGYHPEPAEPGRPRNPQRVATQGESAWTPPDLAEAMDGRGDVVIIYPPARPRT